MKNLKIVNLRTYKEEAGWLLVKVDRSSVLGNPFFMTDESKRNEVCNEYEEYAVRMLAQDGAWMREIRKIKTINETENVALGCWCAPKRCHAETIKRYVEMAHALPSNSIVNGKYKIEESEGDKSPKQGKKFIIAGSRSIVGKENYELLCSFIKEKNLTDSISEVVCGMARGVDELGYCWAKEHNVPIHEMPANWDKFGKGAGFLRNKEMAEYADGLILIWDGVSKGALDMFNRALDAELEVHYVNIAPPYTQEIICELPWASGTEQKVICSCKRTHTKKETEENICTECGLMIDATIEIAASKPVLIAGSYICPQCGRELTEEEVNNICTDCGATLDKSTVSEEIVLGERVIRRHINTEDKTNSLHFVPTCGVCGEEIFGRNCPCGEHNKGEVSTKEKRPELKNDEVSIPSNLYVHAKDCHCDTCLPMRKQEIENVQRFGCKNPL